MTLWEDRPQVAAVMLNPAVCSVLIAESARAYADQAEAEAMPLPLAFLVLPLVLHRPTRNVLPRDTRTYLTVWLDRNPVLRASFPARAEALVEHGREALRFGLRNTLLQLDGGGVASRVRATDSTVPKDLSRAARLAGRWFQLSGPAPTVFQALGVRP